MRKGEILGRKWSDIIFIPAPCSIRPADEAVTEPSDSSADGCYCSPRATSFRIYYTPSGEAQPTVQGIQKTARLGFREEVSARSEACRRRCSAHPRDLRHFELDADTGAGIEDNIIGLLMGHKSGNCDGTSTSERGAEAQDRRSDRRGA